MEERSLLFAGFIQREEDIMEGDAFMGAYQASGVFKIHPFEPHPVNERTAHLRVEYRTNRKCSDANLPKLSDGTYSLLTENLDVFLDGIRDGYSSVQRTFDQQALNWLKSIDTSYIERQLSLAEYYVHIDLERISRANPDGVG